MSDNAAKILATAIVMASLAYFAVHLHASDHANTYTLIYNTVTGNGYVCPSADCGWRPPVAPN